MPTTKTISHIGDTKFELVKDTYDAFRFTVDDKSSNPNSPKTVMYISSEPTDSNAPTPLSTSGRVTMSNIRTEGATSTSSADVDGNIGVGGKILIREGTGTGTATRAAIYAEKDTTASNNHRLIIDPYKEDDADNSDSANNGTVYIRGNLIVEGDKTILDTAEHITSENLLGINAIRDTNGNVTGGTATAAGIHVYSGVTDAQFLYNFGTGRWRTASMNSLSLNDLEAKDVYVTTLDTTNIVATGTSTLTTVNIDGGNIDGTVIGATTPSTAKFTTVDVLSTLGVSSDATVGGTLGVTGVTTLSNNATVGGTLGVTGVTTLSDNATVGGTLGVTGATTLSTVDVSSNATVGGTLGVTGVTTLSNNATVGGTLGVTGVTTLSDNATVGGTLGVTGATTLSTVDVSSNATVGGTLGVTGVTTLSNNATVGGTLGVTGATTLSTVDVSSNATVGGTLGVTGVTTLSNNATVGGTLGVTGVTTLSNNATVGGTLGVTGATTLSTVDVSSNATVGGTLGVTGVTTLSDNATVGGTLGVTGATTLSTVDVSSNATVGGTLGVTGVTTLSNNATVGGTLGVTGATTLSTVDVSSNATVGGTLGVTGVTTLSNNATVGGTLGVTGVTTLSNNATVGGTLGVTGATTLSTVDVSSNATVGGTLGVTGAVTLSSTLAVTDALTAASGNFGTGNVTAGTFTGDLTGNVTGQVSSISNHSTDDLSEGSTSLYYTDTRARASISLKSGESILQYDNATGILSTNLSEGGLGGLGDITLTSVAGSDILTYDASTSKWVNSDSLTIVGETNLGPFALSKRDAANSDPDKRSIIFTDDRDPNGDTTHRIFDVGSGSDTSGNSYYKRILGDDTISVVSRGVSARTIGNIVPVELTSSGGRTSTKVITATASSVPLHADILAYYSGKAFAAGKCVAALTNGTHSSVAMFSFSVCGSVLTMVLDQEVHSSSAALNVDYDSSGTIDLNLGTATSAVYCVKVLPIMTSDSISEQV